MQKICKIDSILDIVNQLKQKDCMKCNKKIHFACEHCARPFTCLYRPSLMFLGIDYVCALRILDSVLVQCKRRHY